MSRGGIAILKDISVNPSPNFIMILNVKKNTEDTTGLTSLVATDLHLDISTKSYGKIEVIQSGREAFMFSTLRANLEH